MLPCSIRILVLNLNSCFGGVGFVRLRCVAQLNFRGMGLGSIYNTVTGMRIMRWDGVFVFFGCGGWLIME